ncbi:hypothetical protein [Mycoplasma sp. 'Moose RK']|uniref:hypothetical protein n=1 Tax=Mycoplasma sp. 'Moose RK' TaxID=2780095 RepID=UPI0018C25D2C|nr:hypothetical protein [Mycoplasma sp. 'Moose RK']MBG0730546.1 hypothetical protein [Mycoplasma sp. 'Moose RK']
MNVGDKILCKIRSLNKKYFWVEMPFGYTGVVFLDTKKLAENQKIEYFYRVGQQLILQIDTISHFEKRASLSDVHSHIFYNNSDFPFETPSGFKNLKKHVEQQLNYEPKFTNKNKN